MQTTRWMGMFCVTLFLVAAGAGYAAKTNYVSLAGTSVTPPYTSWDLATTNIQDAINDAVAGDTVLVSNGTYWINSEVLIDKAITVKGVSGAAETAVIRATPGTNMPHHRIFKVTAAATLDGFTVQNGYLTNTPAGVDAASQGGGIYMSAGTVQNCVVYSNAVQSYWASRGGGIWMGGSSILRFSTVISNNCPQQGSGGGVFATSSALLVSNTIAFNIGDGAALYNSPRAQSCVFENNTGSGVYGYGTTMSNCVIRFNKAGTGGGFYSVNGNTVYDTVIESNTASTLGGAIYVSGAYSPLLFRRCVIRGNTNNATSGAIHFANINPDTGTRVFDLCRVTDNRGGRSIYIGSVPLPIQFRNCTIASSSQVGVEVTQVATNQSGVWMYPSFVNTIVYNHQTNIHSTNASLLTSLLTNFTYSCSPQLTVPGYSNVTENPIFAGAAAGDYRLKATSPCAKSGTTNVLSFYTSDIDYVPYGTTANMGCYETLVPVIGTLIYVR